MSLYEAAALGVNMSVPYGAWMGSVVHDSFWPPHELCVEIQQFLAEHEHLYSRETWSETAVVYSIESSFEEVARPDELSDNRMNLSEAEAGPFWAACEALSRAAQPYDVLMFPDGELRADSLTDDDLARYRTIVLPDCRTLTEHQAALLERFAAEAPEYAWVIECERRLRGYVFGRRGHLRDQIGPLVADDEELAGALLDACLGAGPEGGVFLDALDDQRSWRATLAKRGFAVQRPFLRMYRGQLTTPGEPSRIFAITGPEFG